MSMLEVVTAGIALVGAAIFVVGVVFVLASAQRRPYQAETAPIKGSPAEGVLYAFTLGMAPWAKESARRHWVAYIRGIIIHVGIFVAAAFLMASPWLALMPEPLRISLAALFGVGAILGLAGFWMRMADPSLRLLSTPDDYFSLALVTLFLASAAASAASIELLPAFWAISGVTMAYAPFGKIKHFMFFFYERVFVGLFFGRRGTLEWKHE
jgi:nitrate reductase gamma subunit